MSEFVKQQEAKIALGPGRFFDIGEDFYCRSPDGLILGPFPNRPIARASLRKYIRMLRDSSASGLPPKLTALCQFFKPEKASD